jgi:hypothetical protein
VLTFLGDPLVGSLDEGEFTQHRAAFSLPALDGRLFLCPGPRVFQERRSLPLKWFSFRSRDPLVSSRKRLSTRCDVAGKDSRVVGQLGSAAPLLCKRLTRASGIGRFARVELPLPVPVVAYGKDRRR